MENLKISGIDEIISFDVNMSEEQQFYFTKDITRTTIDTITVSITCNTISSKWINIYIDIENQTKYKYDDDTYINNRSKFFVFNQRTKEFTELKQM